MEEKSNVPLRFFDWMFVRSFCENGEASAVSMVRREAISKREGWRMSSFKYTRECGISIRLCPGFSLHKGRECDAASSFDLRYVSPESGAGKKPGMDEGGRPLPVRSRSYRARSVGGFLLLVADDLPHAAFVEVCSMKHNDVLSFTVESHVFHPTCGFL